MIIRGAAGSREVPAPAEVISSWHISRDGAVRQLAAPEPVAQARAPYAKADLICGTCARQFRGRSDRRFCSKACWEANRRPASASGDFVWRGVERSA